MHKSLTIIFLLCLAASCFSQDITIKKGNQTKRFKAKSIFEITIKDNLRVEEDCDCYDRTHLIGTISAIQEDSIVMEVTTLQTNKKVGNSRIDNSVTLEESSMTNTIAKADISSLKTYKSAKHKRKKDNRMAIGALSIVGSFGSLVGILLVPEQENKFKLVKTSAILIASGIAFLGSGNQKTYQFKDVVDPWSF